MCPVDFRGTLLPVRLSTILYGLMQIAILFGVIMFNQSMATETGQAMGGAAVGFMALGFAAVATAIVYWSIEGVKRLMGKPRSPPMIPPRGAFDNLRRSAPARQIDSDH